MSFSILCEDVIMEIRNFIYSNRTMINLATTCKYFKRLGDKYGNIKHLEYNLNTNLFTFLHMYCYHKSLQTLNIHNVPSPFNYIPRDVAWPKEIAFYSCIFGAKRLEPPLSNNTESFTYISNFCVNPWISNVLRIEWNRLPHLKTLIVRARNIDFKGLEECRKLEKIIIELDSDRELPEWIAELPNLRELITTCKTPKHLHFTSKNLAVCLLSTKHRLTTLSRKLPRNHLLDNSNINVSAFM